LQAFHKVTAFLSFFPHSFQVNRFSPVAQFACLSLPVAAVGVDVAAGLLVGF